MCGRFVATTAPQQLALLFDAVLDDRGAEQSAPNYNVAPTTGILMLRSRLHAPDPVRTLSRAHWGLLPGWSKDRTRASSMINARSETLTETPSFRPLLTGHRCVIPVDGYYEWRTVGVDARARQPKQPYYIRATNDLPLALAGLWTTWHDPRLGGETVESCAIITTNPNARLAEIHDRMPCVLEEGDIDEWLTAPGAPLELLRSASEDVLTAVTVSTAVNNVRNKGAALIEPTRTTLF
jgi:putative SOS response-associated peptidase YedK